MGAEDLELLERIDALRADLLDSLGRHDEARALRASSVTVGGPPVEVSGPSAAELARDRGLVPIGESAYVSQQALAVLQQAANRPSASGS